MSDKIIKIGDDFWNIRGSFRVGGVVNIGTHASLIRRPSGRFVMLDSYAVSGDVKHQVDVLTNDGEMIDAIINLHPFHTVHVPAMHAMYPNAKLYGTERHKRRAPDLPFDSLAVDDPKFSDLFADVLEFSLPRGVDFISDNENVHFSSVLAFHRASGTIHVDDTLMYLRAALGAFKSGVRFHPTLPLALEKRRGASDDLRDWANDLIEEWGEARNLCAAHNAALRARGALAPRLKKALRRAEIYLKAHELRYR